MLFKLYSTIAALHFNFHDFISCNFSIFKSCTHTCNGWIVVSNYSKLEWIIILLGIERTFL